MEGINVNWSVNLYPQKRHNINGFNWKSAVSLAESRNYFSQIEIDTTKLSWESSLHLHISSLSIILKKRLHAGLTIWHV